jgi:predicted  nucleic acid-binding Zn-ribbon protein
VKTIKKASPAVKAELEKSVDRIESSIENLLIRKSEVEKAIRTSNEQNAQQKRQIQSAFEEVKLKLAQKEKEILARFDTDLSESLEELEKSIKAIVKRIEDLRGYSSGTTDFLKR